MLLIKYLHFLTFKFFRACALAIYNAPSISQNITNWLNILAMVAEPYN